MKLCKCINSEYFDKLGQSDYDIHKGDVVYYEAYDVIDIGGGVIQTLFEITNKKGKVYLIERDFKKTFIDLYQHRIKVINRLCS